MAERNSITLDVCDAMKAALVAHAWDTVEPAEILIGPVPAGWMTWPCIGIMGGDGETDKEQTNHLYAVSTEVFRWSLGEMLELAGPDVTEQWQRHTEWREECLRIARKAVNRLWGVAAVRYSVARGWETAVVVSPIQTATQSILTTEIQIEVSYHEAIE